MLRSSRSPRPKGRNQRVQTTGASLLNVQVLVTPAGRLVWVSDPCPGSTHDVAALDASGLLEGLDVSGWVADKGYIGRGMINPARKPAGKKISDTAKEVSRSINRVRYIVEQVNAHIKTWKILKEDYRRPPWTHSHKPSQPPSCSTPTPPLE